ncbi:MAG: UvrD-helicase domain-containing protein [Pseudomonadales bacterium]|nr:UvrD-helicase domain-containing protein [Pseudomonadales bacterium]
MTRFDPHQMPLVGRKLLEASAGTGKTFALGSLVLRALLGQRGPDALDAPALRIDEMLMVTFTRAATAELRDRLGQRLREALSAFRERAAPKDPFLAQLWAQSADRPRDEARLRAALGQLDEAPVFTIHGFCHRALLEGALEQATPFTFENLEDDKALQGEALRTAWRRRFYPASPWVQSLWLRVWADPEACERIFSSWLAPGALAFRGVPEADLETLGAAVAQALDALRDAWLQRDRAPAVLGLPDFGKAGTAWGALSERYHGNARGPGKAALQHALDTALAAELAPLAAIKALLGGGKKTDPVLLAPFTPEAFANTKVKKGQATVSGGALAAAAEALGEAAEAFAAKLTHTLFQDLAAALSEHKAQRQLRGPEDALRQLAVSLQGPQGRALAERLAVRYPLAFIDEFQDTDPVQLEIFEALYPLGGAGTLVLIGDPKQAIYGFRGADLFAYLKARDALGASDRLRMDQNWRSSPPVLEALNRLYGQQPDPFLNGALGFDPVAAAKTTPAQPWERGGRPAPALGFYRSTAVGRVEAQAEATVALLQRLLAEATIKGKPLKQEQCALLVHTHAEGARLQRCLRAAGLGSAFASKQSVFATETAEDGFRVLRAMVDPEDGAGLRDALLTPLLGVPRDSLASTDALGAHQTRFRHFRALWERQGVLTALFALLEAYAVPARCLQRPEGPRMLTDLRHLGECLERFDRTGGGPAETLRAFTQARGAEDSNEAHQQRLESDENLVKIVTVHGSKGLEYDVVLVPFPREEREEAFPLFHDPAVGGMAVDLRKGPGACAAAAREKLGESLRLLYVALTRARHAVYVGVPQARGPMSEAAQSASALAHALGLQGLAPKAWAEALIAAGWPLEVFEPGDPAGEGAAAADAAEVALAPAKWVAPRSFPREARVSYSSLLRQDLQAGAEPAGFGDEGRDAPLLESPTPLSAPAAQFPAGAMPGTCLHDMLETWPAEANALPAHLERCLRRHGLWGAPGVTVEGVESWLSAVRATPLIAGRALADIPHQRPELAFDLRLKDLSLPELEGRIRAAGYPMPSLPAQRLTGFLRGFIDVVLVVNGRYYVVDYKSNRLGMHREAYGPEGLRAAMESHHYAFQYLIYAVALRRLLRRRLGPGGEAAFGGVRYLFLRGMAPGSSLGIFVDDPAPALLDALDRCFSAEVG